MNPEYFYPPKKKEKKKFQRDQIGDWE